MDTLENKTPAENEVTELRDQVESLRHLVGSMLILLVVVSGTFNIYLLRQWKTSKTDLAVFKPQAANLIASYQKNEQPAVENFIKKMVEYGQTHPEDNNERQAIHEHVSVALAPAPQKKTPSPKVAAKTAQHDSVKPGGGK